jgi:hypothetical protein
MDPDAIDRVLRKHARAVGLTRGYNPEKSASFYATY